MSFTSKFFGATSSSDEESEVEIEEKPKQVPKIPKKFLESSDDEDKKKRVVRSVESKKKDEFRTLTKKIKNSLKIKDFDNVLNEFDALVKTITKYSNSELPEPVVKTLIGIENVVRMCWDDKETKTKLNKQKLKSLTTLKQKIKKYNIAHAEIIEKCREDSDKFQSEFSDSVDEDRDEDYKDEVLKQKPAGALAFLKKDVVKELTKDAGKKRERKTKVPKGSDDTRTLPTGSENNRTLPSISEDIREGPKTSDNFRVVSTTHDGSRTHSGISKGLTKGGPTSSRQKSLGKNLQFDLLGESIKDLSDEQIVTKMFEIYRQRGKKISDKVDMFSNDSAVKYDQFKSILLSFSSLLTLIKDNPTVHIQPEISEEQENFSTPPYYISGNFIHYIFNIREELNLILQNTDSYSLEYLVKMKDVLEFDQLVVQLQNYVETAASKNQICEIYMLRIEQSYYKMDQNWLLSLKEQLEDSLTIDSGVINKDQCTDEYFLDGLCRYLYSFGSVKMKAQALLCQVYHHAIHDRFSKARELFLRSQLQENIAQYDVNVKIIFNRALVQLGLCAFRKGFYTDSYNALRDIQQSGMVKELLAQGLLRNVERTQKQEMKERQRLLPFHMHVNLELVECAYLLSILVLEAAYSVSPVKEIRNRFSGRGLVYLIRNFEKIPLNGPPESLRECVFAAYKCLRVGDWRGCVDNVKKIKCWKLLVHYDSVMQTLVSKLKQQCLMAYLFVNCVVYTNIKLSTLVEKFEITECEVKSLVNRMIVNDAFPAQWNESSTVLNLHHHMLPNNLDVLCSAFIEKLSSQIDQNNRLGEISSMIRSLKEKTKSHQIQTLS